MRIVAISDTHGFHRFVDVPNGDVLVHAGDITMNGEMEIVEDFAQWLAALPHAHKIVVPGNHDKCFDISQTKYDGRSIALFDRPGMHLLMDAARVLDVGEESIKVYGAPWVPNLPGWAFWDRNYDKFEHAPRDVDLLVTHGPPLGIRDDNIMDTHFGSRHIARYLNRCPMVRAHVFGHVHQGHSMGKRGEILFANACTCDRNYDPVNPPLVFDL
jgi:calcineurin-like phosphoesterase family protein